MIWLVFSTAEPVPVPRAFMTSFIAVTVLLFAQVASPQAPVKYVSAHEGMSAVFPAQFHATDAGEGCHETELLVQHLDALLRVVSKGPAHRGTRTRDSSWCPTAPTHDPLWHPGRSP